MMSTNPEKIEGPKPEKKKKALVGAVKKAKINPKLVIVQDVIHLMNEADISELSFEQGGVKIHLRRGPGMSFQPAMAPVMTQAVPAATLPAASAAPSAPAAKGDNGVTLNSPMVGTFYRAPSPDAKGFIEGVDKVAV